ncbi:RNA polymerase sigma factor [Paraglaciecola sp.]|uniref:RNA polymerase sigma factor n=1 Tax=Paraglaciecola sp. TaxID=1920173 RepID=UPI003EF24CD2
MNTHTKQDSTNKEYKDMSAFLVDIEKKAYRMVLMSVGQHADAIDILQDSMIKLVQKYTDKPSAQWRPLFYRIVNNKIIDWHRQQKLKNLLFFWKSDDDDEKNLDNELVDETKSLKLPEEELIKQQQQADMLKELEALSEKQRQCFLLRSWEGLSVAETANVMGCSQGSVKTHYFRAVTKLREVIGEVHNVTI